MKKSHFILSLALCMTMPFLTACGEDNEPVDSGTDYPTGGGGDSGNSGDEIVTPSYPLEISLVGNIDPENINGVEPNDEEIAVLFNRYPVSLTEFKKLRDEYGFSVTGTVALHVMACEMAIHNKKIGEECLKLICSEALLKTYKEFFIGRMNRPEGQGIAPYHVSAFLSGSHWDTGYNPTTPYKIVLQGVKTEYSGIYQADFVFVKLMYDGNYSAFSENRPDNVLHAANFRLVKTADPTVKQCGGGEYYMVTSASDFCSNASIKIKSYSAAYEGVAPFNGK